MFLNSSTNVTQTWLLRLFVKSPKCFYIFVGEKKVQNMENISETVELISQFFGRTRPSSIVVEGTFSTANIEQFASYFFNYPVVKNI